MLIGENGNVFYHILITIPTDQRDHRAGSQLKMAVWLENLTPKPGFNLHLTPTVGLRSMIFSIAGLNRGEYLFLFAKIYSVIISWF